MEHIVTSYITFSQRYTLFNLLYISISIQYDFWNFIFAKNKFYPLFWYKNEYNVFLKTNFTNKLSEKKPLEYYVVRQHQTRRLVWAISLTEAEVLIDYSKHYSNMKWKNETVQAKSYIIRLELIALFGCVWADSTVYCNQPLSNHRHPTILPSYHPTILLSYHPTILPSRSGYNAMVGW